MSDSVERFWAIPFDPNDMEPLPVFIDEQSECWDYNRNTRKFEFAGEFYLNFGDCYPTFEECRAAMIEGRTQALKEARKHAHELAASIEHIRSLPHALFPNVIREVPEAPQEEAQGQEEAKAAEAVTPQPEAEPAKAGARPALKRPSRSK
jgi:hypothetical protein